MKPFLCPLSTLRLSAPKKRLLIGINSIPKHSSHSTPRGESRFSKKRQANHFRPLALKINFSTVEFQTLEVIWGVSLFFY